MNIFISWSGIKSNKLAIQISSFLKETIQATNPWMSSSITKGKRWSSELANNLASANYGIICLTRDNLDSEWIIFEAGALSKLKESHLSVLLFDVNHTDVKQPLSQFQHTKFEKDDFKKLIVSINSIVSEYSENPLAPEVLNRIFKRNWNVFEGEVNSILNEKIEVKSNVRWS